MKFYALLTGLVLLAACNNDKKTVTIKDDETGAETTVDMNAMEKVAVDYQKKVEELQKLAPYTLDEMKALLPETLAGAPRSKMKVNSAMGASYGEAEYKINDSTKLELRIFDCAGQAGAGIYSLQFLNIMNFQQETEEEYTKTVDFNGARAVEKVEKDGSRATLVWLAKDRLMVTLEGTNTKIEPVKQLAGSLKF